MHLRNEDGTASATRKELNSRIWWAHYSFERLVSNLTGRPSLGMGPPYSVPLPHPLASEDNEESIIIESRFGEKGRRPPIPHGSISNLQAAYTSTQPHEDYWASGAAANSGSYLRSLVKLGEITQASLELYSGNAVGKPWDSLQRTIAQPNDGLDAWATALPKGLHVFHRT